MGMPIITPGNGTREQAITDIIQSVALEQTALSHILNAEGMKLQEIIGRTTSTTTDILEANKSVKSMVDSVTRLEMILQAKLDLFAESLNIPTEEEEEEEPAEAE